ncbi:iron chelate uptake ABC transporter family permease subunit [Massilia sp. W12]|uniref:iron chelate uptake ABC transporter family permease subunit n=1 Tax=Massilia sp. W12 TaxID=3126507 RepID=UPI0030D47394
MMDALRQQLAQPAQAALAGGKRNSNKPRRSLLPWSVLLLASLAGLALAAMCVGESSVPLAKVWAWLSGTPDATLDVLLGELRLPRFACAAGAGAALALSGYLLQLLCRNPLAGPDLLGVNEAALLALLLGLGLQALLQWPLAALGAGCALLLLFALIVLPAARAGQAVPRERLVLAGIALGALLRALAELWQARQDLAHAMNLAAWSMGSLQGRDATAAWRLLGGLGALLLCLLPWRADLKLYACLPQQAATLGVRQLRLEAKILLCAALAAALALALASPLAFIALAAPALARRLHAGHSLRLCLLCGALLGAAADTLGRWLPLCLPSWLGLQGMDIPAGLICQISAGPLLLWLLLRRDAAHTK